MSRLDIDRDRILVAALASGATQAEAATIAGCSDRTVRRRLTEGAVRAALDAERHRLASEVADALAGRSRAALDRLSGIVADGADRDAVAAARIVLAEGRAWRDSVFVAARLAEVEDVLARRHAS